MNIQPELTYNIAEMRLAGNIDGTTILCMAYSGGRGGTKTKDAENSLIVNNPFLTGLKLDESKKGSIGGPLPMGIYALQNHETTPDRIRLVPQNIAAMKNRDSMAIHGRGPRGSDGCIVPNDFSVVQTIYKLVKSRKEKSHPPILLKVYASGDLDYYQRKFSTV